MSNYDVVVDKTGADRVTIEVGAKANKGAFGFGPAAVRVDPGTTVVWEWTGDGGSHNVVAQDGAFGSDMTDAAGHTFEHTFDAEGVTKYYCEPHKAMGMKGAVAVGESAAADAPVSDAGNGGGGNGGDGSGGGGGDADLTSLAVGVLTGAILTVLFLLPWSDVRRRRSNRAR